MRKIQVQFIDDEEQSFWQMYKRDFIQVIVIGLLIGLAIVAVMWVYLDKLVVQANAEVPTPQQIINMGNSNLLCEWAGVPAKLPTKCPLTVTQGAQGTFTEQNDIQPALGINYIQNAGRNE